MATFNPPKAPTYNYKSQTVTRIRRSDFGDGYSQRSGDGLNAVQKKVDLTFVGLSTFEADAMDAFFAEQGGYRAFFYTLPDEGVPRKWISTPEGWAKEPVGPGKWQFSVQLEEAFDP